MGVVDTTKLRQGEAMKNVAVWLISFQIEIDPLFTPFLICYSFIYYLLAIVGTLERSHANSCSKIHFDVSTRFCGIRIVGEILESNNSKT